MGLVSFGHWIEHFVYTFLQLCFLQEIIVSQELLTGQQSFKENYKGCWF